MVLFTYKKTIYELSPAQLSAHQNTLLYKLWCDNKDEYILIHNPYIDVSDKYFIKILDCVINYYKCGEILVPDFVNTLNLFNKLKYFLIDVPIENYILKQFQHKLSHYRSICIQKQQYVFDVCYHILLDIIQNCCQNGYTECIVILLSDDDEIDQFKSNKSIIHHIRQQYLFFQCETNRREFIKYLKRKNITINFFNYHSNLIEYNIAFNMTWFHK